MPFQDACLDMTADTSKPLGFGPRHGVRRPGVPEDQFMGMMKIDMATGEMKRIEKSADAIGLSSRKSKLLFIASRVE